MKQIESAGYNLSPEIHAKLTGLLQEIEKLAVSEAAREMQIEQLQTALKRYGRHENACRIAIEEKAAGKSVSCVDVYCDCGFEQALNTQEPPSASV